MKWLDNLKAAWQANWVSPAQIPLAVGQWWEYNGIPSNPFPFVKEQGTAAEIRELRKGWVLYILAIKGEYYGGEQVATEPVFRHLFPRLVS